MAALLYGLNVLNGDVLHTVWPHHNMAIFPINPIAYPGDIICEGWVYSLCSAFVIAIWSPFYNMNFNSSMDK